MKRFDHGTFLSFLLVFFFSFVPANAQADENVRVTILHLNDTYQFTPVDGGKRGGLARVMTIRQNTIKENPYTLMTLGGDTLSPSVETRTYRGKQMIDAWNMVGLDYSVLGNHEFDIRTGELLDRIKESEFTWLGSNVFDTKTGKIFAELPPFVIREIGGVKIGIIGLLLPETKETSSMEDHLEVVDFCKTARELIPKMRTAGANTIIGLTHMFMAQDKRLAHCAPGIDLILGGHEHTLLQSSANGVPIFKMWADAREVGKFDLFIDRRTGKLVSMDWEIIPVTDEIPDHPDFAPVVAKYKYLLDQLEVRIGATSVPLDALSHSVRTKETDIGNFIADAYRKAVDADIGFVNGGSIRADLSYNPGPLTKRDVLSMLPFNNPIVKVEVTGKTLMEILEHGVARSAEDNEPGRFPQISGMKFTFDAGKLPGQRIIEVTVGGKPIDPAATYTIATSDFLVSRGGDGYTMFKNAKILLGAEDAPKDSEVFEQAIKDSRDSTISPRIEGRIIRLN
ncbi:MAG TPA: 5'-nucleotidase C-terminal domain-containing protein [Pyrinomonadaceae bacterium]|nr:5'-nucleotidase C-terminal domain-containing protein [Pyrinomonadaceae bacterium]HMP64750.1 5'-nucleotidase C-terminal domain-containing protein [Pyrinomonadaceae bacterium]